MRRRMDREPTDDWDGKIAEHQEKAEMALSCLPDSVVFRLRLLFAAAEDERRAAHRRSITGRREDE